MIMSRVERVDWGWVLSRVERVERVEGVGILAAENAKMFGDGIESKNLLAKSTCSTRFYKYE
jgi:hypothetical protein